MTLNVGWKTWRYGDDAWQQEAWRMYDIIGELRKYCNWIGSAVSRCRLYVAEVDDNGEAANEAEDPDIAALAAGPLGRGPAKDEALRLIGVNLAVAGEAFIVAEADGAEDGDDLWYVISGSEISNTGGSIRIIRPAVGTDGGEFDFQEGEDLLIRCWTPHPRRTMWADSSVRSAIPVLRKIEATMKRSFAELDSRLTGAGVLLLPSNIDFPKGDGIPPGVDGVAKVFANTAAISIEDRSSAEAMVPIIMTADPEAIDKIKYLTFWSDVSETLQPMEDAAIRRLAVQLDLPPEVLMGIGGTNHWNAWAVEESTIKIFIEPVLSRIADALTNHYLNPTLEKMGVDPDKYTYAFDTAALAVRPNRTQDALAFNEKGLISDDSTRRAGDYGDEDKPTPEEQVRKQLLSGIAANPQILDSPRALEILGLKPSGFGIGTPAAEPAGAPPPDVAEVESRGLPQSEPQNGAADAPANAMAASLFPLCNFAVMRAMGLAGSRLVSHRERDRYPGTAKHLLNMCYGETTRSKASEVLRGAWDNLPEAVNDLEVEFDRLQSLLDDFCVRLLIDGSGHDPSLLFDELSRASGYLRSPRRVGAT